MSYSKVSTDYSGSLQFNEYDFELSNFQKNAIQAWHNNCNVLTTAHTGSGKTLQAEYAIKYITENNLGKVIFTTPIKALSNDKFKDFCSKFPNADIGILTGDIKFNPTGNVLIMTTEILRNILYHGSVLDIQTGLSIKIDISTIHTVIFDEVHYINDMYRGTVWEECFILLPEHIRLICLSATIDNPEHFGSWLAKIKHTDLIHTSTEKRVVPLEHALFIDYVKSHLDNKDNVLSKELNNVPLIFSSPACKWDVQKYSSIVTHLKRTKHHLTRSQIINNLITYLDIHTLNPTIVFSFSRKYCEKLAGLVQSNLLADGEQKRIQSIVDKRLRQLTNYKEYLKMDQYTQLMKCVLKGVAYHHSGLLPVFKEIVEILFANKNAAGEHKPLIKVLFATETFAVGVNMPTKTVVFTSLQKYSEGGRRYLQTSEYLQMSGRAGRRGIDTKGLVLLLPNMNDLPPLSKMKDLLLGKSQIICSKFRPNYKIILKAIELNKNLDDVLHSSLVSKEIESENTHIKSQLEALSYPSEMLDNIEIYKQYHTYKTGDYGLIRPSNKKLKKMKKQFYAFEKESGFREHYQTFLKINSNSDTRAKLKKEIENNRDFITHQVSEVKSILSSNGFIADSVITDKGLVANMINECNEIILTELIFSGVLDSIDYIELGTILSIFGSGKKTARVNQVVSLEHTDPYKGALRIVNEIIDKYTALEQRKRLYLHTDWTINVELLNMVHTWISEPDIEFNTLCTTYSLYEGNVIKDLIKINNIIASISEIASLLNKNHLFIQSKKLGECLIRNIVNVESLYIK